MARRRPLAETPSGAARELFDHLRYSAGRKRPQRADAVMSGFAVSSVDLAPAAAPASAAPEYTPPERIADAAGLTGPAASNFAAAVAAAVGAPSAAAFTALRRLAVSLGVEPSRARRATMAAMRSARALAAPLPVAVQGVNPLKKSETGVMKAQKVVETGKRGGKIVGYRTKDGKRVPIYGKDGEDAQPGGDAAPAPAPEAKTPKTDAEPLSLEGPPLDDASVGDPSPGSGEADPYAAMHRDLQAGFDRLDAVQSMLSPEFVPAFNQMKADMRAMGERIDQQAGQWGAGGGQAKARAKATRDALDEALGTASAFVRFIATVSKRALAAAERRIGGDRTQRDAVTKAVASVLRQGALVKGGAVARWLPRRLAALDAVAAPQLAEVEMAEALGRLVKGAGHKYIRRVPKPGGGYRYYYRVSGVTRDVSADLQPGAKFRLEHAGQAGHFEVISRDGDRVRLRHDESGGEMIVGAAALGDLLHREHADVVRERRAKIKRDIAAARVHGTAKQVQRLEAEAKRHGFDALKPRASTGDALPGAAEPAKQMTRAQIESAIAGATHRDYKSGRGKTRSIMHRGHVLTLSELAPADLVNLYADKHGGERVEVKATTRRRAVKPAPAFPAAGEAEGVRPHIAASAVPGSFIYKDGQPFMLVDDAGRFRDAEGTIVAKARARMILVSERGLSVIGPPAPSQTGAEGPPNSAYRVEPAVGPTPYATALGVALGPDQMPVSVGRDAYQHISHSPELRGEHVQADYIRHVEHVAQALAGHVKSDAGRMEAMAQMEAYRDGYAKRVKAWMGAKGQTFSWAITGRGGLTPAKIRSNEKKQAAERRRLDDLGRFEKKALASALKAVKAVDAPPAAVKPKTGDGRVPFFQHRDEANAVTVEDDASADRVRLHFDDKPSAEMISKLKGKGFRWSRAQGAWQRQRTDNARYAIRGLGIDYPMTGGIGPAGREGTAKSHGARQHRVDALRKALAQPSPKTPRELLRESLRELDPPPSPNRHPYPYVGTLTLPGPLPVNIEMARGMTRSGTDADGRAWAVQMPAHYGEIAGTLGADGDPIDVFVGPAVNEATHVYLVALRDVRTGKYDEDKVFFGFQSKADALACYRAAYDRRDVGLDCRGMPLAEFLVWLDRHGEKGRRIDAGRLMRLKRSLGRVQAPAREDALRASLRRGMVRERDRLRVAAKETQ